MPDQDDHLPFGLYERLITAGLKARLLRLDPAAARVVRISVDPAEAHATLARYIEDLLANALEDLPREGRAAKQAELANDIINFIADRQADAIDIPPAQLRSIQPTGGRLAGDPDIVAPLVPLSDSDLLVNARGEPNLAHALAHEIPSADSIDLLCAFVRWHGIRVGQFYQHREGVCRDQGTNSDLFFITLEKSERDYSPSTLYKDYAISPTQFHWESQSITTQHSPTGQRYIRHREFNGNVLLFVRSRKKQDGLTVPYTFLGLVDYVSHKQERPIQFVWQLRRPMPADFFRQTKVATA